MEGLIMYLSLPAIDTLLSFIVQNSGKGSAILFDCSVKTEANIPSHVPRKNLGEHTARGGEPMRFAIPIEGAEAFLTQRGFFQVRTVTSDECRKMYFQGKNEDRKNFLSSLFMYAVVE